MEMRSTPEASLVGGDGEISDRLSGSCTQIGCVAGTLCA